MKARRTIDDYRDIIDLPRPEHDDHVRMPLEKRAAQFAPFAALTGYGEAVEEALAWHVAAFLQDDGHRGDMVEEDWEI